MTSSTNPTTLRAQLRQRRKQLTPAQQSQHALQATSYLQEFLETYAMQISSQVCRPLKIGLFLSQDGELNTQSGIEYVWHSTQHQLFLPALETKPELHMAFVEYHETSLMIENQFGIAEPQAPLDEHLTGQEMDIVFMPLVGFDLNGNRMGMGGGYYDRSFAFKHAPQDAVQQTLLIGWAHSCQQVKQLPTEPWDVPLDGIITEQGFQSFRPLDL